MARTSCGCGRCSVDFTEDHRIGKEILAGVADQYRKLRNTFRYLLGALDGFSDEERLDDVAQYPELERYMLHLAAGARREAAQRGRGLRLQQLRPRADRLRQRGFERLLFRYPQGQPLLRRAGLGEAPRLPDRARHPVPCAGALARAGAGVHDRGSVGHALSRCGVGAFARMAGDAAGRCRRCEAGRRCARFAPR